MPDLVRDRSSTAVATYRVQLTPRFGFSDLRQWIGYLRKLGVSTVYTSPIFQAQSGSEHGYDVVDPTRLNAELGSPDEFDALARAIGEAGMQLLIDIVPNHMAARAENPWWTDLLRQGPDSPYATYFDVDWSAEAIRENLADKVLLPVLGKPYGDVLEDQEIRIAYDDGSFRVEYYERRMPLNFSSYVRIFQNTRTRLLRRGDEESAGVIEPILFALNEWGHSAHEAPASEEIDQLHQRIRRLVEDHPAVAGALDRTLLVLNGKRGDPESFDELDTILEEQSYRLSFWRNAAEEINYRRFFDITDLISIRVTDPEVFAATHSLAFELIRQGKVHGLRLDHIDGLYDPTLYLEMLGEQLEVIEPEVMVISEKILGEHEEIPENFRYRGTTGYELARDLDRIFVDPAGFETLDRSFRQISGLDSGFHSFARESKIRVIRDLFRGELNSFTRRFAQLTGEDRHARDLPVSALEEALVQLTASLPVYRTYVRDHAVLQRDVEIVRAATDDAIDHLDSEPVIAAVRFLLRVLTIDTEDEAQLQSWRRFAMRFQQFTGPVAAKGIEDTALYVYTPLVSLNEVGAEPVLPHDTVQSFHSLNRYRLGSAPETLSASSTHDTKRGEDTRCRIHVLSEIPDEWEGFRRKWGAVDSDDGEREHAPSEEERWFFLQNLVGIWPITSAGWDGFGDRVAGYVRKALREAKVHSHWISIDEEWESATIRWIDHLLENEQFRGEMENLQERIAFPGVLNSLAMAVLKIASPGIPDIYQGCESWNFSLVDPDNRRPVDYGSHARMFEELQQRVEAGEHPGSIIEELREEWRDGRIKLWVTWRALGARKENPDLFLSGDYEPLEPSGRGAHHVVAFARRRDEQWAIAVAGRLLSSAGDDRLDGTSLALPNDAPRSWKSAMTGKTVEPGASIDLSEILSVVPADILVSS